MGRCRTGPRADASDQGHVRSGRHLRAGTFRGGRGETMIPTVQEIGHSLHELLAVDRRRFIESARAIPIPDLAEVLRSMPAHQATELVVALPFEVAVELFDEPELEGHRKGIACCLPPDMAARLIHAMSAATHAGQMGLGRPGDSQALIIYLELAT